MTNDATYDAGRALHEELPQHSRWVQKLARSLVRDETVAEDVAQEAQLAALRRGPALPGSLGPWLARVTRNFARRGWRDAARRAARERAVARPEALPGADESAARLEIQQRLVVELAALEPAVRHALVRRYLDGWSAARIARESGEPAATVRWRLQRGLAELRVRLDRRSGGDGIQWRLALLPLIGSASPWTAWLSRHSPAGAATIHGALTMKAATQALAVGAVVAAVGLGAWWTIGRRDEAAAQASAEEVPLRVSLAEPAELPPEPVRAPQALREAIPVSPSPREEAPASATPPMPKLQGRCVDEGLVPIAAARIAQVGEAHATATRADGSFALDVTTDRWNDCMLRIEAEGFATRFVESMLHQEGPTSLGDLILQPGGSLRGRVFGPGRVPFAGATITITGPDLGGSLEEARVSGPPLVNGLGGTSGDDGRFRIDGVGTGPARAWAGAEGMRHAISAPLEVRARMATEEVELVLEPVRSDDRITGIVLSPEGEPVSGETVNVECGERWGGGWNSFFVKPDSSGRFELAAKRNHVYDLTASDDRWSPAQVRGVVPGTHDVELVFLEARWIEVRARAQDGDAVEEYDLRAEKDGEWLETAKEEPRAEGRGRVRVPSEPFFVCVDARGFAPSQQGPFSPEAPPRTLEFELSSEPGVRGRVLADGEPVSGARVALHRSNASERIEHFGYACLAAPKVEDETTADADGRFVLRMRKRGTYVVRAEAEGRAAADVGPLELAPETGLVDLELDLRRGGALEGRVLVAAGRDPAGVIVAVNRGDAYPRTVRSDAEGRFRFERLTAGPWHLLRGKLEVNPLGGGTAYSVAKTPTVIPFNCTIREGETTFQDLDLRDFQPCELAGVLLVNGAAAADWSVRAWPGAKTAVVGEPPSSATAADGSFTLSIDEPGTLRLSFTPPAEVGGQGRIDALFEVRPGPNQWREDFTMGRLSGRCLSSAATDGSALFYRSAEGVKPSCWLPILPDEDGRYAFPFVPAGKGSIGTMREDDGWRWRVLLETEIPARGERVLDIP